MAGLEADTSSYNQPLPVSPLKQVGEIGALQQQKLQIDQAKLDQANQGLTYMTRAMGALGPNAPKEAYIKAAADAVKMGLVPENQLQVFVQKAQAAPDSKSFYDEFMTTAADHQQQINYHIGQNAEQNNGATVYQGVRKPASQGGGFAPATKMAVQPPPGSPYFEGGQAKTLGPSGPEGVQPASGGLPVASPQGPGSTAPIVPKPVRSLPVERPVSGPTGPSREITDQVPTTLQNRMAAGFNAAPPPMFEEGKKTLAENQLRASGLMQNAKPAIQALKIMKTAFPDGKTLATGPGTKQFNDLVATAKAWGITDTKAENDPTVLRQELEKKLAQFVGTSPIASRSDAAQTLAEASSPNPKTQLLPALINLTRDAVALSRVEAAKALTFKGDDFSKVGEHIAKFPQSVDEKAFGLDLMEPKDRDALIKKMALQYKNGDARQKKEAVKFKNSLDISKELGFYE